ncbi:MAG: GGDEF domain-containing protein, partial [Desulfobulbus sp.]
AGLPAWRLVEIAATDAQGFDLFEIISQDLERRNVLAIVMLVGLYDTMFGSAKKVESMPAGSATCCRAGKIMKVGTSRSDKRVHFLTGCFRGVMTTQHDMSLSQSPGQERWRVKDRQEPQAAVRFPSWQEQKIQYRTRYLFWCLAIAFFNLSHGMSLSVLTRFQMNIALMIYVGCVTAMYLHAMRLHFCPARFRLAMWVDIVIVTIAVVNDPYPLPPAELVFIVVVLGNGMRYGMRIFAEALVGSFAGIVLAFTLRFHANVLELSTGLIFLNLFGGIILIYSYFLMGRIEKTRIQLEQQSRVDPLTGVMNRRALFDQATPLFQQAERTRSPLAVLFADLDKFKAVNDSFGHSAGDQVLRDFAAILRDSVRRYDVVARLGGDEFVLLLPDSTLALAEQTARRIQQAVSEYAAVKSLDFSVTFGLGEAPRHGSELAVILDRVDNALYQSKNCARRSGLSFATDDSPARSA